MGDISVLFILFYLVEKIIGISFWITRKINKKKVNMPIVQCQFKEKSPVETKVYNMSFGLLCYHIDNIKKKENSIHSRLVLKSNLSDIELEIKRKWLNSDKSVLKSKFKNNLDLSRYAVTKEGREYLKYIEKQKD